MAIEIVDFPIIFMVIFHSYVKLPEGRDSLFMDSDNPCLPWGGGQL
jgi:hypothetical protein